MNAVKPLMGLMKGVNPSALPTLAAAPVKIFSSVLNNIVELLKGLFEGASSTPQVVDISKDLGLQHSAEDLETDPQDLSREGPVPIRDFNVPDENVRAGLREEIERRLDELPYEEAALQVDAIRQMLRNLDAKGPTGDAASGNPGSVVDEIMHALDAFRPKSDVGLDLPQHGTDPGMQAQQTVLAESAPGFSSTSALERAPQVPVKPPAEIAPDPAKPAPPKELVSLDLQSVRPPRVVPPPAAPDAPSLAKVVTDAVATPVDVEPPAPSAPPLPANPLAASLTVAEAARTDGASAVRTEGSARGLETSEVRRSEAFSSALRGAQSQTAAPDTDRVEFVERMLKAAKLTQLKGQSRLKMVLNPPHLGSLKVDLAMKDHVLNGSLRAENLAAKEMILSHLQSLKDSLENQGIHVGDFTVCVDQGFEQAQRDLDRGAAKEGGLPKPAPAESPRPETAGDSLSRLRSARLQMIDVMA